jgi:hypothetical protein
MINAKSALVAVALCLSGLLAVDSAWAQGEGSGEVEYSDSVDVTEFRPAEPGSRAERVSASLVVTLAYGAMWLLVLGLVFALWRRMSGLTGELESAKSRLSQLDQRLGERLPDDADTG